MKHEKIYSAMIQPIKAQISDLETVFPVKIKLLMPIRSHIPDFNWSSLRDVGNAEAAVWHKHFVTSWQKEVVETGVSAFDVKDSELEWMTLAERLRFELFYYKQNNGQHLDTNTVTICAGSRFGHGLSWVPTVYKNRSGPGVCIGCTGVMDATPNMGPRQVWRT
jgi:hypothetical protein